MGTHGMRYSLQSRDLIADSIETVTQAQWYDANVSLVHPYSHNATYLTARMRQEHGTANLP